MSQCTQQPTHRKVRNLPNFETCCCQSFQLVSSPGSEIAIRRQVIERALSMFIHIWSLIRSRDAAFSKIGRHRVIQKHLARYGPLSVFDFMSRRKPLWLCLLQRRRGLFLQLSALKMVKTAAAGAFPAGLPSCAPRHISISSIIKYTSAQMKIVLG